MHEVPVAAQGIVKIFCEAAMLSPADYHTARRITALCQERDPLVELAAALTVRQLRSGSVCFDVHRAQTLQPLDDTDTGGLDVAPVELPWPDTEAWLTALRRSPAVALVQDTVAKPLRLDEHRLYLERYYRDETKLAQALRRRRQLPRRDVDQQALERALGHNALGNVPDQDQTEAIKLAVSHATTVITGGPGTGKTATAARIIDAICADQPVTVALAAPTAKAADQLTTSVKALSQAPHARLYGNLTLHRLLGAFPGSETRTYHKHHPLPYQVVIVDEVSMVSLTMMSWLFDALPDSAQLILLGDASQLTSVEEGAVLAELTNHELLPVQRLHTNHRSNQAINQLAQAINAADAPTALATIEANPEISLVEWTPERPMLTDPDVCQLLERYGSTVLTAATRGDALGARDAHLMQRVLCAHREGPYGVAAWGSAVRRWLTTHVEGYHGDAPRFPGQPLLITRKNMFASNGETAVVIETPDGLRAVLAKGDDVMLVHPDALEYTQDLHAMTIHKSQGSQFHTVVLILPPVTSPLLVRELMYTAITRARDRVLILGTPEQLTTAIETPTRRDGGLAHRTLEEVSVAQR